MKDKVYEHVYQTFYQTARMGALRLSDGGGPFGFDITVAIQVDYLLQAYGCDAIVETGCYLGDSTAYLAATYPELPIVTCDVVPQYVRFTRHRLRECRKVQVIEGDSPDVVRQACASYTRPFFYLDAHWYDQWPLVKEIEAIRRGVVCVDDFDIGHPRFAYDIYNDVPCGPVYLHAFMTSCHSIT